MVGGSVINTGTISAPSGTITLAAVPSQSQVALKHDGMVLSFLFDALAVDEVQPDTPLGIRAADLPSYLNGSHAMGKVNEVVRTENGELWLVGSQMRVVDGDVVIGGRVTADDVNLIAANRGKVTDPALVEGDTTVVRLPEAGGTNTLSVIDSRADHPEALLYGGAAGTIAKIINRDEDGIEVITEELADIAAEGGKLDAVSITAEGHEGNFWLGNAWITDESVNDYSDQLIAWRDTLTDSADLLLYSCFTALGATGEALMSSLANLTGADVAASTNATGSANYGGDWLLESSTGSIETGNPFAADTLSFWDGKLATLTVTDFSDGGGANTLRSLIGSAAAGDLIQFASAGTVTLTMGQINWTTNNLTLDGNGGTVSGNNASRVFNITAPNATINNLTIRDAQVTGNGGGIYHTGTGTLAITNSTITGNTITGSANFGGGAGLRTRGSLLMNNSTAVGNSSNGDGGAISADRSGSISNSIISGNIAGDDGAAILINAGASYFTITHSTVSNNVGNNTSGSSSTGTITNQAGILNIINSTISNNSVQLNGGAIASNGSMVNISGSTLANNTAGAIGGGAIYIGIGGGSLTVANSTISGNSSTGLGGGIRAVAVPISLSNVTLAFNTAGTNGGGIHSNSTTTLNNTIISNNAAGGTGPDLSGTFTANYSLILNTSGATISGSNNIIGQDPLLQPLANNGGPTQTHATTTGSPTYNTGGNGLVVSPRDRTDQRGFVPGIFGGRVDIGAYEFGAVDPTPAPTPTLTLTPTNSNPTLNTDLFDAQEETEALTDEFLRIYSCQTIPELELEKDDDEDGEQIEEDLNATDGIDLDEDCLPVNDPAAGIVFSP
jgi:hypothetical protein